MSESVKRVVFCDFDGTITTEDAFVRVCKQFAPEIVDRFLKEIFKGRLTLKEGIRDIIQSIPSERYPEMLDYVNGTEIRPGLDNLLDYLESEGVPFVVISGGLTGLVKRQLGRYIDRVDGVFAADVDSSGEYLRIISEFDNGPELVNKTQVMDRYSYTESVAIGDGMTNHGMALAAPVVFARHHLANYMDENSRPYHSWGDFFDVKTTLEQRWK